MEKPKRGTQRRIYIDVLGKERVYENPTPKSIGRNGKFPRCQTIDGGNGIGKGRAKCGEKLHIARINWNLKQDVCMGFICPKCQTLYIDNDIVKNVYKVDIVDYNGDKMEV